MEVREIVNEEIKKGMRLIHKRGYKNKGWREDKVKTVTNVVMTTNGTHSHVVYDDGGFDYLFDLGDHYFEVVEDKPTGVQLFKESIASKLEQEVVHIDESDLAIGYMKAICLVPTAGLEDSYVLFKDEVYLVKDSDDPLKYIVQLNGGRIITANKNRFEVVGREPVVLGIPTFGGNLPTGTKLDSDKVKPSLLLDDMPLAIQEILKVLQFGAKKYSEGNWLKVPNGISRYRNAADRHRLAIDELDEESGLLHLAHEATSILMLLELKLKEQQNAE